MKSTGKLLRVNHPEIVGANLFASDSCSLSCGEIETWSISAINISPGVGDGKGLEQSGPFFYFPDELMASSL